MTSRPYFQQSAHLLETLSSEDVATALLNISKASYSKIFTDSNNYIISFVLLNLIVLFKDETNDGTSTASDIRVSIQETGPITDEVVPACLSTPNPASGDSHRIFCKDVVRLVETSNIHKHSTTCYKYSKGKSDTSKTCRMRMPRVLVKTSNIDLSTGQITMRRSHPWINNFNEWLISACRSNMDIKFI
ncbi:unnamed protein product [Rotaria magnacalcarata]|uniref:Uncharacterized protein n=1 Tax=Rotaria magnacalcarata TaxID=392030 RepID=A0A816CUC5_9BILA|nr:unnamed protein product [Rotaria magnacalcarata]